MIFKRILFFSYLLMTAMSFAETYNVTTKSEALAAIDSIMAKIMPLAAIDPSVIQAARASVDGLTALLDTPGMIIPAELAQSVAVARESAKKNSDYLNSIPNIISEKTRFMQIRDQLIALISTLADPVVAPQLSQASLSAAISAADMAVKNVSTSISSTLQTIADARSSFDSLIASPLLAGKIAPLNWK